MLFSRKFKKYKIRFAVIGIFILLGVNIYLNVDCLLCVNEMETAEQLAINTPKPLAIPEQLTDQCTKIIGGDREEIIKAKTYTNKQKKNVTSEMQYFNSLEDCTSFRNNRMYIERPLHEEEEDFPIAFAIMVYKNASQVERLVRMIYRPQNIYCIHVDANSKALFYSVIRSLANCFPNVYLLPERTKVVWSKFSLLEPILSCMNFLLKFKEWKYFINLTGQEFPLKTNWELVQILKAYNGSSDVEGPIRDFELSHRIKRGGKKVNNRIVRQKMPNQSKLRGIPYGITPCRGSVYITTTRDFIHFLLTDEKSQDILTWVKDHLHPDEEYFCNIYHNKKLGAPSAYTGNTRLHQKEKTYMTKLVNWREEAPWQCEGKYVRGVCIMGIGDIGYLVKAEQLFVNKFYEDYQYLALDCMEQWYYNKVKNEYTYGTRLNVTFYKQLPFVNNHL